MSVQAPNNVMGIQLWHVTEADDTLFERIEYLMDFTAPAAEGETYDDTRIDKDDNYMEFSTGLINPGDAELVLRWRPQTEGDTTYNRLMGMEGQNSKFQLRLPERLGSTSITFEAAIKALPVDFQVKDKSTVTVKLKVRGKSTEGVWV